MKVKDLISVLSKLPKDSEVKMYLFTQVSPGEKYSLGRAIMSCDVFEIHDVLVASFGNQVLLSSHQLAYEKSTSVL